jgi:hypothetical protein
LGAAIGSEEIQGSGEARIALAPGWNGEVDWHYGSVEDLGLSPGIDGLLSSLSALTRGEDYRDPYWSSGVGARIAFPLTEGSTGWVTLGFERMENLELAVERAPLNRDRSFRPIRPIIDGNFGRVGAGLRGGISFPGNGRGWGEVAGELLSGGAGGGGSLSLSVDGRWGPLSGEQEIQVLLRGWNWWGDSLPQGERLLGGRGTLPGYAFRAFSGERAIAASLEGSVEAWGPYLRLRGGLHSGWSSGDGPEGWETTETGGLRTSATLGVGIGWDLLRIDLARGFDGGEWQWIFSVDPAWWGRL